ncbi:MAG: antibiotic biosynthesis monooxygenase [Methanobrevibacter sp.]|nr:antibiotic biosynthesis monooxygenase [Methanobrevibacter sp.]MCL2157361.1 antibiotic biosynthesis monooxygenase [Methanobrevibacter sp.]
MIIVLAKITSKDGMKDKIISKTDSIIKATRAEDGCIEYNLYDPIDSKNNLLFVEKWEGKEFLQAHVQQDHFIKFGEDIGEFLAKDLEISVYSSEEIEL